MTDDKTTSNNASEYNQRVSKDIPYYETILSEVIEFARSYKEKYQTWLDTGCGTGSLGCKIISESLTEKMILADPSPDMLEIAKERNSDKGTEFYNFKTQDLQLDGNSINIITAIQAHHYGDNNDRKVATANCFRMLAKDGLFITTEHYHPGNEIAKEMFLRYWMNHQLSVGKSEEEATKFLKRFNTEYFPISIDEHVKLYKEAGFTTVEILWKSYMQAAFVMVK